MKRANNGRIITKPDIFTKFNGIQWFAMIWLILRLGEQRQTLLCQPCLGKNMFEFYLAQFQA
jgi:hypothetical protein